MNVGVELTPDSIRAALADKDRAGRETLARLWLTEGIPSAFARCPGVFDQVRSWLATRLSLHPKEISVVGSSRVGFSLSPPPKFGQAFGNHSDLDLLAVNSSMFKFVCSEFQQFADDYQQGKIAPKSQREGELWQENIERLPRNIRQGFVDSKFIANRYDTVKKVASTMWELRERLAVTKDAPRVRRASLRIYRDWDAAVSRISFNLSTTLESA